MTPELPPFGEPPWSAPLDADESLAALPDGAQMKGMFLAAIVARATDAGVTLPSARPRYTAFQWYPLREHCALLIELARAVWPNEPLRQGLRRIGRGAAPALVGSTLGKVMVGSAIGPAQVVREMAKAYMLLAQPGTIAVVEDTPGRMVIALRDVCFFVDSHHVGVYEGALRFAEARQPTVRIRRVGPNDLDLLCEWQT